MTKIAVVSLDVAGTSTEQNLAKFQHYIEEAAAEGVELIVFPEMSLQGMHMGLREFTSEAAVYVHQIAELTPEGPSTQKLIALAKEHDMYICWGMLEQDEDRFDALYNTCVLVGPEGFVGKYRKVHQALAERLYLYAGDGDYPVFDTRIGKIGLSVCFDKAFPEVARILSIKGAEIIVTPTAWRAVTRDENDNDFQLSKVFALARAMENMVFYVEATQGGPMRSGHSRIVGPNPNQIFAETGYDEEMAIADVDIRGEIMKARLCGMAGSDLLKDRRPGTYGVLVENNRYVLNYGALPPKDEN